MNSPGQPQSPNPVADWYAEWSGRTPLVTRYTLQTLAALYIVSWFSTATMALINIPYYTILKLELYRLVLAPLLPGSILSLLFILMSFSAMGPRLEQALGSAQLLVLMGTLSLMSNLSFVLFCFVMASLGTYEALFFQCQGFWVVLMGLIVIECLEHPGGHRQLLFIPMPIPTKYYPLALFALFSLFTGPRLDMALSMGIGYLYQKGHLDLLKPSAHTIMQWENGCLANLTTRPFYITQGSAQGAGAWSMAAPSDMSERSSGASPFGGMFGGGQQQQQRQGQDPEAGGSSFWSRDNRPAGSGLGGPGGGSEADAFPGGGQALGSSSRGFGSSSSAMDAEAARAARLAAINARTGGMGPTGAGASFQWPMELEKLEAMGYSRADSMAALEAGHGNLNTAINHLTGSG